VHVIPATPLPNGLTFDDKLMGNPANGRAMLLGMKAPCLTCHNIRGEKQFIPDDMAQGPNLTHVGSRLTIGGGLFPNDDAHMARWIKNSGLMKPGSKMPTLGAGETNPMTKTVVPAAAGLTDQQITDIVAYLRLLK
jgi:cytochrome c oxidase subunit 2